MDFDFDHGKDVAPEIDGEFLALDELARLIADSRELTLALEAMKEMLGMDMGMLAGEFVDPGFWEPSMPE